MEYGRSVASKWLRAVERADKAEAALADALRRGTAALMACDGLILLQSGLHGGLDPLSVEQRAALTAWWDGLTLGQIGELAGEKAKITATRSRAVRGRYVYRLGTPGDGCDVVVVGDVFDPADMDRASAVAILGEPFVRAAEEARPVVAGTPVYYRVLRAGEQDPCKP